MFDGADPTVQAVLVGPDAWPSFVERVWPHLERMAAGSGGRYEAVDIAKCIAQGRMQLWLALEGAAILCAMVTEIIIYPRRRALRCVGIVGHRWRRWAHLLLRIEEIAKEHGGCDLAEAFVQPGHERLLRTGNWRLFHSLWEKDL